MAGRGRGMTQPAWMAQGTQGIYGPSSAEGPVVRAREDDGQEDRNVRQRTENENGAASPNYDDMPLEGLQSAKHILPRPPSLETEVALLFPQGYLASAQVELKANMFAVNATPAAEYYQYSVSVMQNKEEEGPRRANKEVSRTGFDIVRRKHLRGYMLAYDGGNSVYSVREIEEIQPEREFTGIKLKRKILTVTIRFVAKHSYEFCLTNMTQIDKYSSVEYRALQVFDVVLRERMNQERSLINLGGRSYFDPLSTTSIRNGAATIVGFTQAIRPVHAYGGSLALTINQTVTLTYAPMSLLELLEVKVGRQRVEDTLKDPRRYGPHLKDVLVTLNYRGPGLGKRYRIKKIIDKTALTYTFPINDDQGNVIEEKTVQQYFWERYQVDLRFPGLPLAMCMGRKGFEMCIPLECMIIVPGLKYTGKDKFTTATLDAMGADPRGRFENIAKFAGSITYCHPTTPEGNECAMNAFGIHDIPSRGLGDMLSVNAVRLTPPEMSWGEGNSTEMGAWDLRGRTFNSPVRLDKPWAVIGFNVDERAVNDAAKALSMDFPRYGITFTNEEWLRDPFKACTGDRVEDIREIFENGRLQSIEHFGKEFALIVCVKGTNDTRNYGNIKLVGDKLDGIVTQVVVYNKQRWNPQYWGNVILKINAKLGGKNNILTRDIMAKFPNEEAMVIGIAVSRTLEAATPAPRGPRAGKPKPEFCYAAMVGSLDQHCVQFSSSIRRQAKGQRYLTNATEMTVDLLDKFWEANYGFIPSNVLIYREGLNANSVPKMLYTEVKAIMEAFKQFREGKGLEGVRPRVTCITVQKQHRVRFAAIEEHDVDSRSKNCLPGTLVYNTVTDPCAFDFYLFSHMGLKGTSIPTHYRVCLNETNLEACDIFRITYDLSYVYQRATKSVSMVPPVYYAHLLANRAHHYYDPADAPIDLENETNPVHNTLNGQNFFC